MSDDRRLRGVRYVLSLVDGTLSRPTVPPVRSIHDGRSVTRAPARRICAAPLDPYHGFGVDGRGVGAERLFLVSCRYCRVPIATVTRVGAEELEAMLTHLRACRPSALVVDPPRMETLLRHFDVRPAEHDVP